MDELEKIVVNLFSEVKNKEVEVPVWPEHPFDKEHFQTKWYIVPIKDLRNLNMIFPIPDMQKHYNAAVIKRIIKIYSCYYDHIFLIFVYSSANTLYITLIGT